MSSAVPATGGTVAPLRRSTINQAIGRAVAVLERQGLRLPPFAFWTVEDWLAKGREVNEIRNCRLGWDVTDFGSGEFGRIGRTLFTLRNGRHGDAGYPKPYCEKFLIDPEGQRAPRHFHRSKCEDIVNRGEVGNLIIQLCATDEQEQPLEEPFKLQVDGCSIAVEPWGIVRLEPGMSISIPPRTIHTFWGEPGTGLEQDGTLYSVSGEVSSISDDVNDNVFLSEGLVRFRTIDEDEPRKWYLCQEYPRLGSH